MKRGSGFTLIELMIVVAVIGILMAIAIPNYSEYVTRSRITEATSTLSDMRVKLEQYFQDNRTYIGACAAGTVAPLPAVLPNASFAFTCPTLTATTFVVTATGQGKMAGFVYTVDQSNVKASTIAAGSAWPAAANAACWMTSKGGGC